MKKNSNIFLRAVAVVIILFCTVTIIKMQFEFNNLKEDKAEVEEQIKAYELKIDELQARLEENFDTEYIMRIAREKLNFRLPEEIIFYNDLTK